MNKLLISFAFLLCIVLVVLFVVSNSYRSPATKLADSAPQTTVGANQQTITPPSVENPSDSANLPGDNVLPATVTQTEIPQPAGINQNATQESIDPESDSSQKKNGIMPVELLNWEFKQFFMAGGQKVAIVEIRNASGEIETRELKEGQVLENGLQIMAISDKAITIKKGELEYDLEYIVKPEALNNPDINRTMTDEERKEATEFFEKKIFAQFRAVQNSENQLKPEDYPQPVDAQTLQKLNDALSSGEMALNPTQSSSDEEKQNTNDALDQYKKEMENVATPEERMKIITDRILPTMNSMDEFTEYWNHFHSGEKMPNVVVSKEIMEDGTIKDRLVIQGSK